MRVLRLQLINDVIINTLLGSSDVILRLINPFLPAHADVLDRRRSQLRKLLDGVDANAAEHVGDLWLDRKEHCNRRAFGNISPLINEGIPLPRPAMLIAILNLPLRRLKPRFTRLMYLHISLLIINRPSRSSRPLIIPDRGPIELNDLPLIPLTKGYPRSTSAIRRMKPRIDLADRR